MRCTLTFFSRPLLLLIVVLGLLAGCNGRQSQIDAQAREITLKTAQIATQGENLAAQERQLDEQAEHIASQARALAAQAKEITAQGQDIEQLRHEIEQFRSVSATEPGDTHGYASPEALVDMLNAEVGKGEEADPLVFMDACRFQNETGKQFFSIVMRVMDCSGRMEQAIRETLGEDAVRDIMDSQDLGMGGMMDDVPFTSVSIASREGDRVLLDTVGGDEDMQPELIRIDGHWYIDGDALMDLDDPAKAAGVAMAAGMLKMLIEPQVSAMETVITGLQNGTITSIEEVNESLKSANPFGAFIGNVEEDDDEADLVIAEATPLLPLLTSSAGLLDDELRFGNGAVLIIRESNVSLEPVGDILDSDPPLSDPETGTIAATVIFHLAYSSLNAAGEGAEPGTWDIQAEYEWKEEANTFFEHVRGWNRVGLSWGGQPGVLPDGLEAMDTIGAWLDDALATARASE